MTEYSIRAKRGGVALSILLAFTVSDARLAPGATVGQGTSDVDEVWALEDAYWQHVADYRRHVRGDAPRS